MRENCMMETLEQFISKREDADAFLHDLNKQELKKLVKDLANDVHHKKEKLSVVQRQIQTFQSDMEKRVTEKEGWVLLAAQIVDLEPALRKEQETMQRLCVQTQELQRHCQNSSGSRDQDDSELEEEWEGKLASLHQEKTLLQEKKDHLTRELETTQDTLSETQLKNRSAEEDLLRLQKETSDADSGRFLQREEADRLLDKYVQQLGLLETINEERKKK
nr:PREDICTED: uncharacterized protein LOC102354623 [Latimeria chalumnae]|eukprot:XP_014348935.1 PREDICTED: uncharacterized protein LOC102354623 [Latimeria chalumnae]